MSEILHEGNLFHLRNRHISYVLYLVPGGIPAHIYFGARLESIRPEPLLRHMGVSADENFSIQGCALDRLSQEYPSFGLGDMREGALSAVGKDGTDAVDLRFVSASEENGKPTLEGLPATFGTDCRTLRLTLRDAHTGLKAELLYTIFDDLDVIARSARLTNDGSSTMWLTKALSLCLDLPDSNWELITLNGAWARERSIYRRALMPGEQGTGSRNGASSLQTSPFIALVRPGTNENQGEAIGTSLVYSGNFTASVFVNQYGGARLLAGINDRCFRWHLDPGDSFQTPEAVLVYSTSGLGDMSRTFHTLWQQHLLPQRWAHKPRPVLLNSWEAAYFSFDEEKLLSIAKAAADAGVDLFVLDDGWFGHRDDDTTSLGDWHSDLKKLPGGIRRLGERVRALGIQFGIWMEPEMISPESDLYRTHPDWCIHIDGRESVTSRNQLTLDLSRQDVRDFICDAVAETLQESGAVYLKWDMNRNFSNIGSALLPPEYQAELPHRYMLGLYEVMERLTCKFPDVLIEGCASGGGRFDPGLLYYVPQFWCSDNTDALCRCQIQYGTSLVIPPSAMGSHVSAVPNHQTGRVTPMETRFAVALSGCFGYELDPTKLTDEEREALRGQVAVAKQTQTLRLDGRFYRLRSPFEGNETAWMTVSQDQSQAVFTAVRSLAQPNFGPPLIRLRGLDPRRCYRIVETGEVFSGDELMESGLLCPFPRGDAASLLYTIEALKA